MLTMCEGDGVHATTLELHDADGIHVEVCIEARSLDFFGDLGSAEAQLAARVFAAYIYIEFLCGSLVDHGSLLSLFGGGCGVCVFCTLAFGGGGGFGGWLGGGRWFCRGRFLGRGLCFGGSRFGRCSFRLSNLGFGLDGLDWSLDGLGFHGLRGLGDLRGFDGRLPCGRLRGCSLRRHSDCCFSASLLVVLLWLDEDAN